MASIPSFEVTLLKIHQNLGLKRPQSKYIDEFIQLDMPLEKHQEWFAKLLDEVFSALEMDEQAKHDAIGNVLEWANFHMALELHTWTGNATQQQVVWHLLAYSYVPAFARRLAFWSLAGSQRQQPIDAGMPGGEFWFLPNWDQVKKTIELPVPQVMAWLVDLLGNQSLEQAMAGLEREENGKTVNGNALRTLQGWRLEEISPKSSKMIEGIFHDDARLEFCGTFEPSTGLSGEDQFQSALDFVLRKGRNATPISLHDQIPMTVERLDAVWNGTAPEEEKQEFVRLITLRYAKPSMATIRQRLRVARMAQEGYKSLLKTLCGDDVDATCTDPAKNKLLQLLALFHNVYNLTIAASKNADTVEDQDVWFEAQFAPWDSADLLLSIMPSQKETAYLQLAQRLTRKFTALEPDSPLEDLVPLGEGNAKEVIKRRLLDLKQEHEEDLRLMALVEKVRQSSPWRALEAEPSYWVVSQFAHTENLSPNARALAIKRLPDLATTPGQIVGADVLELGFLLNGEPKERPKDIQQRVQSLLDKAQASQGYGEWKAPLLHLRAKHRLMQNDFEGACKDFKAALEACSERGFGGVRGEIARDGWAAEIVEFGLNLQNQEFYYRDMLRYGMFPDGMASIESTAAWCEDFFWIDLYVPYPGIEREESLVSKRFNAIFDEAFETIKNANWGGLQLWMKSHAGKLRKAKLPEARSNGVFLLWLKKLDFLESQFRIEMASAGLLSDKPEQRSANLRQAIGLLIETWPEQAMIADFKGQTPLMLVAGNGDAELTRRLLSLSDVDAQDYRGRTALHSAVSGRSPECVAIVLDRNPDVAKVTMGEEQTALHTAVRFGQPECVRLILEEFRGLASQANAAEQTPLDMARDILENLASWQTYMRKENRCTGSKEDFEAIITLLESAVL